MCGILGILPALDSRPFGRVLEILAHRGPDGQSIWQEPEGRITLGHRRLAIIDRSEAGVQPMTRGHLTITCNGEIYNYQEIRAELQKLGHEFHTQTDTEVLLAAWQEWGPACLPRLNGMWAFALWDAKKEKLFLSRDRFGKKPLFFHQRQGRFAFASEMKALVPFLKKVEVSEEFSLLKDDLFGYEPTEKTLIQGISRFPAGHWGELEGNQLKTQSFWNTLDHIHAVPKSYGDQVEEFREIFLDACRIRMRADVPLGTALSGGIDSSATMCGMAQVARSGSNPGYPNQWQHAFVASLPGTALDESREARIVTDFLKIPATFVQIDPIQGILELEDMLFQSEEIYITSPVPMMQTYRAARQAGVFVTLDGHGADELFAGYDTFLFHAFRDCGLNPFSVHNLLQAYRNLAPPDQPQFAKPAAGWKDYLRWVTDFESWAKMKGHWGIELKKAFADQRPIRPGQNKVTDPGQLGSLNQGLYQLFHTQNLPTLLRNYDRYSMGSGVEIRMPFLDHRVVNYLFSVPWSSKIRHGATKALLRDALRPYLPPPIYQRKWKMGFQTPIVEWLKGPWKEYFQDLLAEKSFMESDFIPVQTVKKEITRIIQEPGVSYREGELAYAALSPYLWEKAVLKRFEALHREMQS
ncbi:MAG: asparagine synthase (glutamine-hydrolyzing) [Bacteroidia bacterium]|nr:asparagine synthase (glutamine-hydrolyzing) [Bacteroidia bacterium]